MQVSSNCLRLLHVAPGSVVSLIFANKQQISRKHCQTFCTHKMNLFGIVNKVTEFLCVHLGFIRVSFLSMFYALP